VYSGKRFSLNEGEDTMTLMMSLNTLLRKQVSAWHSQERWRTDENYLGFLNDAEYYDGSSMVRAYRPKHVPSFLEQEGISPKFNVDVYCGAIQRYIAGEHGYVEMWHEAMSARSY